MDPTITEKNICFDGALLGRSMDSIKDDQVTDFEMSEMERYYPADTLLESANNIPT